MTEFVPAARPEVRLSFEDRLYIIQTVNALPLQQFDELVFALDPAKGIIPPESVAQGSRSKALLDWVESPTGPGLAVVDEYLRQIIPRATKTATRLTAFAISGKLGDLSTAEIEAIVQLLRKKTGDDSIDLAFFEEGSIKLILNGSAEGLKKLQKLFESGELAEVLEDFSVEYVRAVDDNTTAARKVHLIQTLRFSGHDLTPVIKEDSNSHSDSAHNSGSMTDGAVTRYDRPLDSQAVGDLSSALGFTRAHYLNSELDLSEIDLSGANLKGINLKGISLAGVDFTNAIVEGAIFGDNPGLSESVKDDLKRRGAIIQDTPDLNELLK